MRVHMNKAQPNLKSAHHFGLFNRLTLTYIYSYSPARRQLPVGLLTAVLRFSKAPRKKM